MSIQELSYILIASAPIIGPIAKRIHSYILRNHPLESRKEFYKNGNVKRENKKFR